MTERIGYADNGQSDNVMYDSPTEFLADVAEKKGECMAQSVIPRDDGTYLCACSCEAWEVVAPDRWKGLDLAREHTGMPALGAGQTIDG